MGCPVMWLTNRADNMCAIYRCINKFVFYFSQFVCAVVLHSVHKQHVLSIYVLKHLDYFATKPCVH